MRKEDLELLFILVIFMLYLILWKYKQYSQKKKSGIDPEVIFNDESTLQHYVGRMIKILSGSVVTIALLKYFKIDFINIFTSHKGLDYIIFDYAGLIISIFGLGICLNAQLVMGNSWRVGIDKKNKSKLVENQIFSIIRNPTYLGIFILNFGIYMILGNFASLLYNFLFILLLEIQTRCEEDYLIQVYGDRYSSYKKKTKRYFPFIY